MAKYRLIQTYPGQNKLGVIALPLAMNAYSYMAENGDLFTADTIENNPQYWEEVVEVDFDWSCLPAWANNYVAMDSDGTWYCFEKEPEIYLWGFEYYYLYVKDPSLIKIPKEFEPKNFTKDWKKSIIKNPNK